MFNSKSMIAVLLSCALCIVANFTLYGTAFAQEEDHPPQIEKIDNQVVHIGDMLTILIKATDEDGDDLLIQLLDQAPFGVDFTDNKDGRATLKWEPKEDQRGTYTFRVQASDADRPLVRSEVEEFQVVVKEGSFVDLVVQMSRRESQVFTNSRANFDITLENQGNISATSVVITNVLSGLAGVTFSAGGPQIDQGGCENNGTARQFVCQIGTIPVGGKVTIFAQVFVLSEEPGEFVNQVFALSAQPDINKADNSTSVTTNVWPPDYADLAITEQIVTHQEVLQYTRFSYLVHFRNHGNSTASNTVLVLSLDGPASQAGHDGGQFECQKDGNSLICQLGDLQPFATGEVRLDLVGEDRGTVALSAQITSDTFDTEPENNTAGLAVAVIRANVDLSIIKTANKSETEVGEQITFSLLVQNLSPNDVNGVVIKDFLPLGMTITQEPQGCFLRSANEIVCSTYSFSGKNPTTPPQFYERTFTYVAQVNKTGQLTNEAIVSALNNVDPNPNNDTAMSIIQVVAPKTTIGTVTVGGTKPVTSTGTVSETGSFSQIPFKVIVDGVEEEGQTDEDGQVRFDLGDKPHEIRVSTLITSSNLSDLSIQFDLNQMPPTGEVQINSNQMLTTTVTLNTEEGESQQHQLLGTAFSWQNRLDVNTASFNLLTLNPQGKRMLSQGASKSPRALMKTEPIEVELVINAVWPHTLYLPSILR